MMKCPECKCTGDTRVYDELFDSEENRRDYGDPLECIVCGRFIAAEATGSVADPPAG